MPYLNIAVVEFQRLSTSIIVNYREIVVVVVVDAARVRFDSLTRAFGDRLNPPAGGKIASTDD